MKKFLTLYSKLHGGVYLKDDNSNYEPLDTKKITVKYLNEHPKLEKHKGDFNTSVSKFFGNCFNI